MPVSKRIRSSSPSSTMEQCCSSPSAISRYISHDSYLTFIPPPSSLSSADQRLTSNSNSNTDADFIDDELWDDWDLPSTASKKTPGKIRTMSSPAVHSRINSITNTIITGPETTNPIPCKEIVLLFSLRIYCCLAVFQASIESTLPSVVSKIAWDDDDDFEQLLSQLPAELSSEKPSLDNESILLPMASIDDKNSTRLDATRRSSAIFTIENQSLVHNATNIELSSQPNSNPNRISLSSLHRANTGPLSSPCVMKSSLPKNSPRVRCDSASVEKNKVLCTEAEIEQKRLAALARRRQREQERQQQKR